MNVNCLPNEVLCRIFDLLLWSDQKRVSLVCCRWNDIINSDRYLRQKKLVLYNYTKVQFFSGVDVQMLNKQRNIEFHSSAMLDTEELLSTVAEALPNAESLVECVDMFLRSDHEQLFEVVIRNLPNLKHLKRLNILANEGFKTFSNGLVIKSETLRKLKLTFYQNTTCQLFAPSLTSLDLVVRYPSDINLLRSVCRQLKDLKINFHSKDSVAQLFLCSFEKLESLHLAIENDKYLPYTLSPTVVNSWNEIRDFIDSMKDLKKLEVVDKCNMLRHNYLKVFVNAEKLTHLSVNYIILDSTMVEFISSFRELQYLNLQGCSTGGGSISLNLPQLSELLMPYKHYSTLPCTTLRNLTTLSYSSSQKNHAMYIQQISRTFKNLKTLNLLNFDYELSPDSFDCLDQLPELSSLTIRDMSISNKLFLCCPKLSILKNLSLTTVVTEISLLDTFPEKCPNLYRLNIDNCFFYIISNSASQTNPFTFELLRVKMPRCHVSTVDSTVFTNEQYDQSPIYIPG
ncbi:uncharacterized protein LOC129746356 [Uranotaenia lowii]|uniref:uncharacterized protein LOC129746356 n=1 Tax=Uranotaenia lowii TaxID=190385 RepID=UPI00247AF1C1|nr:uncharacterized protein LOC129746356 [Uranotaenia lowii]